MAILCEIGHLWLYSFIRNWNKQQCLFWSRFYSYKITTELCYQECRQVVCLKHHYPKSQRSLLWDTQLGGKFCMLFKKKKKFHNKLCVIYTRHHSLLMCDIGSSSFTVDLSYMLVIIHLFNYLFLVILRS